MTLTGAQQQAITAKGNVLVVAGAGTGKTRTLVERCLNCLLHETPPVSVDEILMVTFTEAAAAEMRQRIRKRLEQESVRPGKAGHWQEQLALFETAHFGTLHGFCFQLVRQHFYQLELDPQLAVMPEQETRLLAEETLDDLLEKHYASDHPFSQAVQRLIQTQARGWDQPIRSLILRLHHYAQTLPNPDAWLEEQLAAFSQPTPPAWRQWWNEAFNELPKLWLPNLERLAGTNGAAARCAAAFSPLAAGLTPEILRGFFAEIQDCRTNYPRGKKKSWIDPLKRFFGEISFLESLATSPGAPDPLLEDWGWVREHMATLIRFSVEFFQAFTEAKRELGLVDFHDLEQYALRLLWDPVLNQPTEIARTWRERLRFVFVDEYQDINAAQDQIIRALAREGPAANRFLVGDVKQSIYRFRLANPAIFQNYAREWSQPPNQVVALRDNFRSREGVLNFVNSVFGLLLTPELGGIDYTLDAALLFGAPVERAPLGQAMDSAPGVDLHLLLTEDSEAVDDEETELAQEILDLREAEREARMVALRLRELRESRFQIWDTEAEQFRPVEWRDMAVLLRSPSNKAESYAKEFSRLNLPLQISRAGFYQNLEVSDLLSLLQILDNPLQDLPLLAVLRSPLVGLAINELAEIRLSSPNTPFWTAVNRWKIAGARERQTERNPPPISPPITNHAHPDGNRSRELVEVFLERFTRWRRLGRQASLSRCLETVLGETYYADWVLSQPRGAERLANVRRLVTLAQEFDRFQRQGLFRFLRFTEAQKAVETEPDVPAAASENAVRLMSIHQSKGLEFPVVLLADMGKPFNLTDLRADLILDERYGLCPQVKPPQTRARYPSLPYWLARRRQHRELLSEELRLLYVAFTRARDKLILSGVVSEKKFEAAWRQSAGVNLQTVLGARCYSDWLGAWFCLNAGAQAPDRMAGQTSLVRWRLCNPSALVSPPPGATPTESWPKPIDLTSDAWRLVRQRLIWEYPFIDSTRIPAKTSVSSLRRQAAALEDDVTASAFQSSFSRQPVSGRKPSGARMSAADIGSAHHEFMQLLSLDRVESLSSLKAQAAVFQQQRRLTDAQVSELDFDGLLAFWQSKLGQRIVARKDLVKRELAFTARFAPDDLRGLLGQDLAKIEPGEFILVQGVADLVVLGLDYIWLVDFKTDDVGAADLDRRVREHTPQVELYAAALSRIYRKSVAERWLYFLKPRQAIELNSGLAAGKAAP
jgi:ATP-dependent helicase/nuclease subunit A